MDNGSPILRIAIFVMSGIAGYFVLRWFLSRRSNIRKIPIGIEDPLVSVQ